MMKTLKKVAVVLTAFVLLSLFACNKGNVNNGDGIFDKSQSGDNSISVSDCDSTDSSSSGSQGQNSSGTSQGGQDQPIIGAALDYSQRIDAFLEGAIIGDAEFVTAVKNLGAYDKNAQVKQNSIFAAPKGSGNGTLDDPCSLQDAIDIAKPGQTVYLRQGIYDANAEGSYEGYFLNCKGEKNNFITIRNYPGETPIVTNQYVNNSKGKESNAIVVETVCEYVVLEGLEIADVKSYCAYGICMWDGGQNHLVIRNCSIHDIKTTAANPDKDTESGANAILLFGATNNSLNNMFIMDNEIYNTVTGWAETLSVTANAEYIYVLANNVHDTSNIGIDFYGNANYGASAQFDQPRYCVAAGNTVSNTFCSYSDCAGLYVDGARDIVLQYNTVFNCQYGIEVGSEEKQEQYPVKNILVRNNIVHDNLVVGIRVGGYETSKTGVVYSTTILNNTVYNNTKGQNPSGEIVIAKVDGISFINNIIQTQNGSTNLVASEFVASYTKNVIFQNNIFYAEGKTRDNAEFFMYNSWQEGLEKFEAKINCVGANYYGNVSFDEKFVPDFDNSFVAKSQQNVGKFDFYLNSRQNGNLEIGAVEK